MEVLFLRHGKTKGNLEGRYVGTTDEPLTDKASEELEPMKSVCQKFAPERIFSSPRLRCLQTAKILFPGQTQSVNADLAETDFGEFEYKNYAQLNGNPAYQAWIDSGGMAAFPGGESGGEFRARCQKGFADCMREAMAESLTRVAFTVHGGTIMAIMECYARPKADFYSWQVKNGCGFIAVWDEQTQTLVDVRSVNGEKGDILK